MTFKLKHFDMGQCCSRQQYQQPQNADFPCKHYFRFCYVYMPCCHSWWTCHRCHNENGVCKTRAYAKDSTHLKCKVCDHVQKFPTELPVKCEMCGVRFAEYECLKCHHLCGLLQRPKHCDECGICRLHSDRAFHCNTCNICLDVKLKNNHKCYRRDNEICPICLERTFGGAVILPCGHLIHRDCAKQLFCRLREPECPTCRTVFKERVIVNGRVSLTQPEGNARIWLQLTQ